MDLTKFLKDTENSKQIKIGNASYTIDDSVQAFLKFLDWQSKNENATVSQTIGVVLLYGVGHDAKEKIMTSKGVTLVLLLNAISYIVSIWRQVPVSEILKMFESVLPVEKGDETSNT